MKKLLLIAILTLVCFQSFSQTNGVTAGDTTHVNTYLYSDFKDGYVLMKNGTLEPGQLNYDAFDHQIVFKQGGQVMVLSDLSEIDTVYFSGRKFIPIRKTVYEVLRKTELVDVLVLYDAKTRAMAASAEHSGTSRKSQGEVMGTITSTNSNRSRYQSDFDVEIIRTFYLKRFNDVYKATSDKNVLKAFPESLTPSLKEYLKSTKIDFHDADQMLALVDHALAK